MLVPVLGKPTMEKSSNLVIKRHSKKEIFNQLFNFFADTEIQLNLPVHISRYIPALNIVLQRGFTNHRWHGAG